VSKSNLRNFQRTKEGKILVKELSHLSRRQMKLKVVSQKEVSPNAESPPDIKVKPFKTFSTHFSSFFISQSFLPRLMQRESFHFSLKTLA